MTDRVYIPQLREGSDDCEDGFTWRGWQHTWTRRPQTTRYCAVWTGTADCDVLAHFGTQDSRNPIDD